ncbi:LOW QUALITY PROTEIN: pre-mRNA-splicing factor 18-like [Liolophura sinensis]|uniref:LOW QUALITY PROTEIN: pre-mRNA-splicing factor 18-like n=1 Tax=Liolophura sinensis TaxID=3198878 RepID=UPI0031598FA3
MDILKAEIARKRKQLEQCEVVAPDKKFFKRGDLAKKQEEEYWKKQQRFIYDPASPSTSSKEEAATEKQAAENLKKEEEEKFAQLPRKEVIRRLRERNEPIRLFAESDFEAYIRLKKLEALEPEVNKGFENDFQAAMEKVDKEYLNDLLNSGGESDGNSNDVSVKDDGTTEEDMKKMRDELGQGDTDKDQETILRYLKVSFIERWGETLNARNEEYKRSIKGKMASATHTQTVAYMKPLFRHLKQKVFKCVKVEVDILESMVEITRYMMDRNYLKVCYDVYLEMAIGNAPWPIGVTMVGIHARTGREKISSRYVAHVLNDETQRKYIQGLKRLMTQCQKMFPTDPSHSVNYEKD